MGKKEKKRKRKRELASYPPKPVVTTKHKERAGREMEPAGERQQALQRTQGKPYKWLHQSRRKPEHQKAKCS